MSMLGDVLRSLLRRPATRRYPRERAAPPERLRGALRFDPARCTGCAMCVRDCPADAIELITIDKAARRFVLLYHLDRCTFCAQCARTCSFGCLSLSSERWELAAPSREQLAVYYGDDADVKSVLAAAAAPDTAAPSDA